MKKALGILVLVGLMALPISGLAATLEERIEELNRQTMELKQQLEQMRQQQEQQEEFLTEIDETIYEDRSSRFQWSGDFRTRYDYYSRDRYTGADPNKTITEKNDTLFTNRLRLNMSVQALENVNFVGRLAMYKVWGMQNAPSDRRHRLFWWLSAIDGNLSQLPLMTSCWSTAPSSTEHRGSNFLAFRDGRRPTTDGSPSQLRSNNPNRMAKFPVSYMDRPLMALPWATLTTVSSLSNLPGRIRFAMAVAMKLDWLTALPLPGLSPASAGISTTRTTALFICSPTLP